MFRGYLIYKDTDNGKLCFKRDDGSYSAMAQNPESIEFLITRYLKETHLPIGTRFTEERLR